MPHTSKLILILFLLTLSSITGNSQTVSDISECDTILFKLLEQVWNHHPDLSAMRFMASAESSNIAMKSAWMNPELRLGLMNVPDNFDLGMDPMTMFQIGVMQRLPFPGKLRAESASATAKYRAALAKVKTEQYQMAEMMGMAYYDLLGAWEIDEIYQKGEALFEQMSQASLIMLESGMGLQSEVWRAQIEKSEWELKRKQNQGEIARKKAALEYFLAEPFPESIAWPKLPLSLPEPPSMLPALEDFPTKEKVSFEKQALESNLHSAKLNYLPDGDLMLAYGIRNQYQGMPLDNMLSLELSIPLPLFYRGNQRSGIQEARAMLAQKEAELAVVVLQKQEQLQEILSKWREDYDRYGILQSKILPQIEILWSALLVDYQASRASYMDLSQTRMKLAMSEMEIVMLKAEVMALRMQYHAVRGKLP